MSNKVGIGGSTNFRLVSLLEKKKGKERARKSLQWSTLSLFVILKRTEREKSPSASMFTVCPDFQVMAHREGQCHNTSLPKSKSIRGVGVGAVDATVLSFPCCGTV